MHVKLCTYMHVFSQRMHWVRTSTFLQERDVAQTSSYDQI